MKWTNTILATLFLSFLSQTVQAREVIFNTVADLQNKKFANTDTLLINPDIGSEVDKISSEWPITAVITKFFADKHAVGIKHKEDLGFYHKFALDKTSSPQTVEERLDTLRGLRSNLMKHLSGQS